MVEGNVCEGSIEHSKANVVSEGKQSANVKHVVGLIGVHVEIENGLTEKVRDVVHGTDVIKYM